MRLKKYTLEQLTLAIKNSYSLRAVLVALHIVPAGGSYQTLHKAIREYGLDTSHFTGKAHLKGKRHDWTKRPLDVILVEGKIENTVRLKNRLLSSGLKTRRCEDCDNTLWLDQPIPIELHHIDGNRKNNKIENLSLLCPNCHALTENYRGKNKGHVAEWHTHAP